MCRRRRGRPLSTTDVRLRLRDSCVRAGGQRAWARLYGVSDSHVSDCVRGRREPGPVILAALGLRRGEAVYIPASEGECVHED